MADSLLDNYNPLYDIHLRQYFALPHMQKHLQKMGLLESTLNLNGDEVYARHHAMMDMMLKNREAQLLKMAELRKKLDAAEKVEICRRIRTGQSPESYRRGKPSRSLSRNRAAQKGGSGGRQRRFSNSYEDRDFVQHIEERNADPDDYDTRDPYKRLSANAKRFNYLHKLDDNTLIAYKDNLKKQLQRLERFREISFGPHSVARQPPPPQASWFFRRRSLPSLTASAPGNTLKEPLRSVLQMRGRKTTTGNKLNASHDSRTSCPPTTRKRKDSNTRLPPIHPQKGRVASKPPAPVSLQQTTTKLPPAVKKPAPSRGRPSNKRQTTTTTTTTITAVSKSPTSTLPSLPSVTGHGIFSGAAAAATVAAIGTAAINMDSLISDDTKRTPTPSPPVSPVLETQKTFDRSSPIDGIHNQDLPADLLDHLADESENVPEHVEEELDDHIARQIVLDNAPVDHSHGDYEDSDSEPEYAEEDRQTPEETLAHEPLAVAVSVHADASVPAPESPQELSYNEQVEQEVAQSPSVHLPALPSPVAAPQSPPRSPVHSEHEPSPPSPVIAHVSESPAPSVHSSHASEQMEHHISNAPSPVPSVHEQDLQEVAAPQSPVLSVHSSHASEQIEAPPSPALSLRSSQISEHPAEAAQQSPVLSVHSHHAVEHFEQHDAVPQSPVLSVHGSPASDHHNEEVPQSPILSVHASEHEDSHQEAVPQSPAFSVHSHHSESARSAHGDTLRSPSVHESEHHQEVERSQSPALSVHSSHTSEHHIVADQIEHQVSAPQSPVASEKDVALSVHSEQEPAPQSPPLSIHSSHASEHFEQQPEPNSPVLQSPVAAEQDVARSPSVHSVHGSEPAEHHSPAPASPRDSEKDFAVDRSPSVHSVHGSEPAEHHSPAPASPRDSEKDFAVDRSPSVHSVHGSEPAEHHSPAPASPRDSEKDFAVDRSPSVHSVHGSEPAEHHSPAPASPRDSEKDFAVNRSPSVHDEEPIAQVQHIEPTHEAPESPSIPAEHFSPPVPRSPSVHTSDASEHEHEQEEETFEVQHHAPLSQRSEPEVTAPAAHSPTAMDLYNPSHGNMESPVLSDSEHEHASAPRSPVDAPISPPLPEEVAGGVAIADRLDLDAYHNSPTKESTSPVATNPVEIQVNPEQVVEQLPSPESFENIINQSADEEASHLIQEALTETPAIIDMVNTYEERFSPQVSPRKEADAEDNAMMTSIYQPSSDHEGSQTSLTEKQPEVESKEWDDGDKHVKETTTHSEFTDGNTHHTYSETVTVITDNESNGNAPESPKPVSPNGATADNISTDSLIIHDEPVDHQMTQSIYQPHEEVEENEWDEGNKHVHEVISNVEHTDESGKHYTETVTTTTTVIKSGDDLKNNNDDDDQDEKSILEEDEEHGSNGNVIRETITTTTRTVTSSGLPEGGILVDDGDETNISSI